MAQDRSFNNNNRPLGNNRGGGGNFGDRGGSRDNTAISPAPEVKFFLDSGKKIMNPDLVDSIAENQADKIREKLNSAQLRKFFGEVKGLYNRWQNGEDFNRLLPVIKMIKSKAYYASNSSNKKIPVEFASFILGGIGQIQTQEDFKAFVMYFEAVVGFMYGKGLVTK